MIDEPTPASIDADAVASENELLRRKLAMLTEMLDALLRKLADLEPSLRTANLMRAQAEAREEVARQREIEARVVAEQSKVELIAARDELANLRAIQQGLFNDRAAAAERLVRAEAAHDHAVKALRSQLDQSQQRVRKLDFELSRVKAELADAQVALRTALENQDRYAETNTELNQRIEELEELVAEQRRELGNRSPR